MTAQLISVQDPSKLTHSVSRSWVIIDSNIDSVKTLLDTLIENNEVFLLDSNRDGVEQITALLRSAEVHPQELHLISHGAPGTVYLGNDELSLRTLARYSEQLKTWSVEDVYFYGCNVATGDAGEEFLHKIHSLTQANIAASTHKVGHRALGGTWELNVRLGEIKASSIATSTLQEKYFVTLNAEIFVTTEDNAGNGGVATPDGDFGRGIRVGANGARNTNTDEDLGAIQPIEFNIVTDIDAEVGTAVLFLSVFDVDAPAEQNLVTFNGTELGLLEGENNLTFQSIFQIDNSLILNGNNFVQIDVNIANDPVDWEAEIEKAELLINYVVGETVPGGTAFLDTSSTDQPDYEPGDTVGFTADIDTTATPDQTIEIQAILRDPDGNAVEFDTRQTSANFLIAGDTDADVFTWDVPLDADAVSGTWSIDISVFDADTDEIQFLATETFGVGVVGGDVNCGDPGPVSVFQFKDFVRFEELDEGVSYRGGNAAFDERVYLLANADVQAAVDAGEIASGATHFMTSGSSEGRSTLPLDVEIGGIRLASLVDETYYLDQHGDIQNAVVSGEFTYGFEHFARFGIYEGRNPSLFYDEAVYLGGYSDVAAAVNSGEFSSGLEHFLKHGHIEERNPSTLFIASDYLTANPDVLTAIANDEVQSGFDHFIEYGASEGRINTLLYEEAFYLNTFSDVNDSLVNGSISSGFNQYVPFGQSEARDSGPLFDESAYLGCNPDVADAVASGAYSSGMEHYFRFGRQEERLSYEVSATVPA